MLAQSRRVDVVASDVAQEEGTGGQDRRDQAEAELDRAVVEFQCPGRGRRGFDFSHGGRRRRRRLIYLPVTCSSIFFVEALHACRLATVN